MNLRLKRPITAIIAILFSIALLGIGSFAYYHSSQGRIEKSPNDQKTYRALTLKNQLKVVVVSDPDAHMAAAALLVRKGSFQDPVDMPGLAHFCEHMLFLGTHKFPEPDSFRNFIQSHGGDTNASTSNESTEFHFNVRPEAIGDAIERFADFFVAPLFEKSLVDREINAVDSEYRMHLNEDSWGVMDVSKETANPEHPFSRFSIGNLETLSSDKEKLYKDVVAFHHRHYQPADMALVIVGPQSVNELSALAEKHFTAVPCTAEAPKPIAAIEPVYKQDQLGKEVAIQSKGDYREVVLTFPIPGESHHARKIAGRVLSLILGYEGEGGLPTYLKQQHWVNSVQVQYSNMTDHEDVLTLVYTLTPDGVNHIEDITEKTFGYIQLMKKQGIPSFFMDELKNISYQSFIYEEKTDPESLANALSESMHHYSENQLITHHYLMPKDQFSNEQFNMILATLTPENMRRIIVANDVQGNTVSRWFQVPYRVTAFTPEQIAAWRHAKADPLFALPGKNPYIAEDLALKKPAAFVCTTPKKIERENVTLWHHQDTEFKVPKGDVRINLISTQEPSPEAHMLAKMYAHGVMEDMLAPLYPAAVAGASFNLDIHSRGLSITFSGYNDKQDKLILEVLKRVRDYKMNETQFELLKERVIREVKNFNQVPLYQQGFTELNTMIYHPSWHPEELLLASEQVTLEKVNHYIQNHWTAVKAEVLVNGNYTEKDANELAMVIMSQLPKTVANIDLTAKQKVVKLPQGSLWHHHIHTDDPNHIGIWYVQNPHNDDLTLAKTLLLAKFLEGPFFQKLRVEKQLGYALSVHPYILKKTSGLLFWVQSPQVVPNQLVNEMQQFVKQFQGEFAGVTDQDLALHKESLMHELQQPPLSLQAQTDRWWTTIETGEYEFDRRAKLMAEVEKITAKDMAAFSKQMLEAPTNTGQIFVMTDHAPTESMGTQVGSASDFKAKSRYFSSL